MLAKYLQADTNALCLGCCPSISVTIPPRRLFLYVFIIKLKAPLKIRRVFFSQILGTHKSLCCIVVTNVQV